MPDTANLTAVLDRYFPGVSWEVLCQHRGLSGAVVWQVEVLGQSYAVRRWQTGWGGSQQLLWIHALQQQIQAAGVDFVPVPLTTIQGLTTVGQDSQAWEVSPWMPGEAIKGVFTEPQLAAAATALAEVHLATQECQTWEERNATSQTLENRTKQLRELLVESLADSLSSNLGLMDQTRLLAKWLQPAAENTLGLLKGSEEWNLPTQPVLRDVRRDHLLFTGDEITGLIDFGAVTIETATIDLARMLGESAKNDRELWRLGMKSYMAKRRLLNEERQAIPLIDASGTVLACGNWLRWIAEGKVSHLENHQIADRLADLLFRLEPLAHNDLPASHAIID